MWRLSTLRHRRFADCRATSILNTLCKALHNRHTYAYMLRQAGVSLEVRAEMSGHSVATAMKYGRPKTREKERAADALDEMVTG
jgi:integrase